MNTLDRIIKIIYQELPLHKLTSIKNFNYPEDIYSKYFWIRDPQFRNHIKETYTKCYPKDNTPHELDSILDWIDDSILQVGSYSAEKGNTLDLFFHIADKMLTMTKGRLEVSFDEILEWNGFINKVDLNIFYAAFLAKNGIRKQDYSGLIFHDNSRLESILKKGIADNHVHLKGSGYTSDMNWYHFNTSHKYINWEISSFIQHDYNMEQKEMTLALDKLRIIRLYLYQKLALEKPEKIESLEKITYQEMIRILCAEEEFETIYSSLSSRLEVLKDLQERQNIYSDNQSRKCLEYEVQFLRNIFSCYLDHKLNRFEIYLLNVYLLGLSKFKKVFNQSNEAKGFEAFKYSEDIKEQFIPDDNKEIYRGVFDKYYSGQNIEKVEFRIAPKTKGQAYIKTIDDLDKINDELYQYHKEKNKRDRKIEYGLVIHYIKDDQEFNEKDGQLRKESLHHRLKDNKNALQSFLEGYKEGEAFRENNEKYYQRILGIDTANYEKNCGPENYGPSYRQFKKEVKSKIDLKFTYHAGEDFDSLCSGLRAIDEVLEFLRFKRGDRLGHALALGIDADKYFDHKRMKLGTNLENYLDDLAWLHNFLDQANQLTGERRNFLEREFDQYKYGYELGPELEDISIKDYYDAYCLRGDDPTIYAKMVDQLCQKQEGSQAFHPCQSYEEFYKYLTLEYDYRINWQMENHKKAFSNLKARQIYHSYHYAQKTKKSSRKALLVDLSDTYIEIVKVAQAILREKIYHLEISVESNPTSNRKISYIDKYIDLPMLSINKYLLEENEKDKPPIITFINTDDSAIFQTDLELEYAYVAAALMREGYNKEDVYRYIDYLRENSLQQSFV